MNVRRNWYHLSPDPNLPNPITTVAPPLKEYPDVKEDCWCVAPTVWQCVVAITPRFKKMRERFIYEFDADLLIPATETSDFDIVDEYRITADVLEKNDGRIPTKIVGEICFDAAVTTNLKVARLDTKRGLHAFDEKELLWEVREDVWQPRFKNHTDIGHRFDKLNREKAALK